MHEDSFREGGIMRNSIKAEGGVWTFLSNHAHVLICLACESMITMRDIADKVGITERAVQQIIANLAAEGFIDVGKEGRRNVYSVNKERALRHPLEQGRQIGDLILLFCGKKGKPNYRKASAEST
jgi:DNA-binding transcriptional ArsR family regulator